MISYVVVKNFRSIVEVLLDLRYGEGKAPNGFLKSERFPFLIEKGCKERIVPCMALFGSNANGKTNILRAVATLQRAVGDSRIDIRRLYEPNQIATSGPKESEFAIEFVKEGTVYNYKIIYSDAGLLAETLLADGQTLFSISGEECDFAHIATKEPYNETAMKEIFRVECGDSDGHRIRPFLNAIGHRFRGLNQYVQTAYVALANEMCIFTGNSEPDLFPVAVDMLRAAMRDSEPKNALEAIVEIVRKCDVDVKNIRVDEQEIGLQSPRAMVVRTDHATQKEYNVFIKSTHENDRGEMVVFDFMTQESEGTVRLATVVAHLLRAIYLGVPLFFDELDRSLHPLLVRAVLSLFQQRARNQKNAQIIFTTHCTDLMDDEILRISEIGIVMKNAAMGTKVKRISDFRKEGTDVRNVTNFRNRYLEGFYSGVPYPAL